MLSTDHVERELKNPKAASDWCVGDAPPRWDFGFTSQLFGQFKRFWSGKEIGDSASIDTMKHPAFFRDAAALRRIPPHGRKAA